MAELRMNQFSEMGKAGNMTIHAPVVGDMVVSSVTIALADATFSATTQPIVELYAEADCHINFDAAATTSTYFMAAGERLPFILQPGTVVHVKNTA